MMISNRFRRRTTKPSRATKRGRGKDEQGQRAVVQHELRAHRSGGEARALWLLLSALRQSMRGPSNTRRAWRAAVMDVEWKSRAANVHAIYKLRSVRLAWIHNPRAFRNMTTLKQAARELADAAIKLDDVRTAFNRGLLPATVLASACQCYYEALAAYRAAEQQESSDDDTKRKRSV